MPEWPSKIPNTDWGGKPFRPICSFRSSITMFTSSMESRRPSYSLTTTTLASFALSAGPAVWSDAKLTSLDRMKDAGNSWMPWMPVRLDLRVIYAVYSWKRNTHSICSSRHAKRSRMKLRDLRVICSPSGPLGGEGDTAATSVRGTGNPSGCLCSSSRNSFSPSCEIMKKRGTHKDTFCSPTSHFSNHPQWPLEPSSLRSICRGVHSVMERTRVSGGTGGARCLCEGVASDLSAASPGGWSEADRKRASEAGSEHSREEVRDLCTVGLGGSRGAGAGSTALVLAPRARVCSFFTQWESTPGLAASPPSLHAGSLSSHSFPFFDFFFRIAEVGW
mmetsp:Transcript_2112/g.4933  ORF Transcript_2112/g.4933 Transcript_2112/m.4933 type:complete len:333 (+) Transcript_2112:1252-2250(+)